MANTNDSPNGHSEDEDFNSAQKVLDDFILKPFKEQKAFVKRLRNLAAEYKDIPEMSQVCKNIADSLEIEINKNKYANQLDKNKQG